MSRIAIFFLLILAPALALVLALLGLETLGKNILGWLLLVIGVGYPAGAITYFWLYKEPFWKTRAGGDTLVEEIGDRSFWLILPGFLATFFVPPLEYMYFQIFIPHTGWMQAIGLALIALGTALRLWARSSIKGQYSGHIQVTTEQQLIQSGPYRYIRHPGYAGYLVMALGICIGYSSLIGLAAIAGLMLPAFVYRMDLEERFLTRSFGDEYRSYVRGTKRILPGIW